MVELHCHKNHNPPNPTPNASPQERVAESLEFLQNADWEIQKTGVAQLNELIQEPDGVVVVKPDLASIIEMILPDNYQSSASNPLLLRPASTVMGPTCALRILAQNNSSLQQHIRHTQQYQMLKQIHNSKGLISEKDTAPWHVYTPTKFDVTIALENMIKDVDGEPLEEAQTRSGDALLPTVVHWKRFGIFVCYSAAGTLLFPVALGASIGFSALTAAALAVGVPFYLSVEGFKTLTRQSRKRKTRRRADTAEENDNNAIAKR